MCLNRARQRRRHRRSVEDWAHLYDHAANADASPEFQAWMTKSGWQWQLKGSDPQVVHNARPQRIPFILRRKGSGPECSESIAP